MQRIASSLVSGALLAGFCALAACGDGDNIPTGADATGKADSPASTPAPAAEVAVGTLVTTTEGSGSSSNAYFKIVPSVELGGARIDTKQAREFGGASDFWILGKSVYVAPGGSLKVSRFERNAEGALVENGSVDFGTFGIPDVAFWNQVFVSPTKAYVTRGADELIVWNPTTMLITGTIDVPGIAPRNNLIARASLSDRSNMLVDGKLYRTIHWTDEDYAKRDPQSLVVVIDTATDKVVQTITVDCAGLDYGTVTDEGKIIFSTWTGSVASRLVLNDHPTCFAEIDPKTNTVTSVTNFAAVTGGREGAALRNIGGGKLGFSVIDPTKISNAPGQDARAVVAGPVFQFWSFDPKTKQGAPMEGIEHNSGAVYEGKVKGQHWVLIPGANYANTTVFRIVDGKAIKGFEMEGWVLRLFSFPN